MASPPEETPHHCRTDNYRAVAAAGWTAANPSKGVIRFFDGKIYRMGPTTEAEWRIKVLDADDPGCWFNVVFKLRPGYQFQRLDAWPPGLEATRIWRD